nr:hypothetical protein [Rhodoplanes sp.]
MEKFAECSCPGFFDLLSQSIDSDRDLADVVVTTAIRLAVRLETAALVEMKNGPADLMERQSFIEGPCPQCERIEALHGVTLGRVFWQQAVKIKVLEQCGLPPLETIPPATHGACGAAFYSEGCALQISPAGRAAIAEDSRSSAEDLDGRSGLIESKSTPS